ncbi:hypothetical protein ACFFJX_10710 [Pseudarcicella hirudinis]|uniref:hypothetical protein n=1 Tax=Pseudarcicella hirudinis TaxID=1079859 RepID=UPI0035E818BB
MQRSTENLLKRIEGTNFRIDFIPTQYQDGSSSYKLLDSVKVFSKTPGAGLSLVKAYDFGFDSNRNSKLLVSIQEFGSGADRLPFYEFEYYRASQLTNIDGWSLDIDFKNYYNYYDRLHNGTNHNTTLLVDNGANRSPNLESTMLGALTKIKYPTGGYTGFEYESNDFSYVRESPYVGPGGQKKTTAPGLRLRTMTDNDSRGNNVVKTYEYRSFADTTLSSGIAWEELDPYSIGFGAFLQCGHNYGFVIEGLSYCPSRYIEFYRVYKSEPFYALSKDPIYYFNVREKVGGSTLNRTDYTYTSHFDFPDFMGSSYGLSNNRMGSVASKDFARSLPKIIQYYNSEGTLVSEKKMEYVLSNRYKSPGVDIDDILTTRPAGETYVFMKTIYTYSGWLRKVKETVTQY